jgi:phosphoadenosine phosphosulfate reductase
MSKITETEISEINEELEKATAQEVLDWAVRRFGSNIALASSFGAEDVVVIDLLTKVTKTPRVFTLDTGRLHQETYNVIDAVREKYKIPIEIYFPQTSKVEEISTKDGENLFYKSVEQRTLCCHIRKREPLKRALSGLDAWITGLRKDQASSRASIKKVEFDAVNGNIVKVNPMRDWTLEQVWSYIHENDVPYNKLFDQGYTSIGCAPCTRQTKPGEDPRAGRWWWETTTKECGLHYKFKV